MTERSGFRPDRLRLGEWVIGVASLALLIDLFLPWYSLKAAFSRTSAEFGAATSSTGIQSHHLLGIFALICALVGLTVWGLQMVSRGPALPLCFTVITWFLSAFLTIGLFIRVVIDPPGVSVLGAPGVNTIKTDVPAVLGLFLAALLFWGTWLSLRRDGISERDAPARIETLRLAKRSA